MRRCEQPRRRAPSTRIPATVSAILMVSALLTACTISGNPKPEYADPAGLDAGAYGIEPLDEPANGQEKYGRMLESVRLAATMLDPVAVDPALTSDVGGGYRLAPVPTPAVATR